MLFGIACCAGTPARALTVTGISATANCDALTGMSFSSSGNVTVTDGAGVVIAWISSQGAPFIPFEGPTNNTQWTVTDANGPVNIVPANFASQCAPASLAVSAGNFYARIVQGGLGSPPTGSFAISNTGGSAIYQPATPYFPNGTAFFDLSAVPPIGPDSGASTTVTLNAAAFALAPGRYSASIDFSNAANLSLVTTRQVQLTVVRGVSHDHDGDGFSDIAWRYTDGNPSIWLMNAGQVVGNKSVGVVPTTFGLVAQRDFNNDGKTDWLWRDTNGDTSIWFLNGTQVTSAVNVANIPTTWTLVATGDFNNDGNGDIVWRDASGNVSIWLMNAAQVLSSGGIGNVPSTWSIVGTGDFNGDGNTDLLWQDNAGDVAIWFMSGLQVSSSAGVGNVGFLWSVAGTGDFNGDGLSDILWQDASGNTAIWLMNGVNVASSGGLGNIPTTLWSIVDTGDFNGDGYSDILWRDTSGNTAFWYMNGLTILSTTGIGNIPLNWTIQGASVD